jgi:hypothetical protein
VNLTNGSDDGCAPSFGSNGKAGPLAMLNCDAAASAGIRRLPPVAHLALGGSASVPGSASLYPTPYSNRLALQPLRYLSLLNPSNRRIRDPYVRWCGRGGVASFPPIPIEDFLCNCVCNSEGNQHIARLFLSRSPCDDRVRRCSQSEGGSNPVFFFVAPALDCFAHSTPRTPRTPATSAPIWSAAASRSAL